MNTYEVIATKEFLNDDLKFVIKAQSEDDAYDRAYELAAKKGYWLDTYEHVDITNLDEELLS